MSIRSQKFIAAIGGSLVVVMLLGYGLLDQRQALTLALPAASVSADSYAQSSGSVADASTGQVLGATSETPASPQDTLTNAYVNPFAQVLGLAPAPLSSGVSGSEQLMAPLVNSSTHNKVTTAVYVRGFVYPIVELGSCSDATGCYQYCQSSANLNQCATFSMKHGFMPTMPIPQVLGDEIALPDIQTQDPNDPAYMLEKISQPGGGGGAIDSSLGLGNNSIPGVCSDTSSCLQYCQGLNSPTSACLDFEQKIGLIDPQLKQLILSGQNQDAGPDSSAPAASLPSTTNDPQLQQQQASNNLTNCTNGVASSDGTPIAPATDAQNAAAVANIQQCLAQYQQTVGNIGPTSYDQTKQSTLNSIDSIQQCLNSLKDFSGGISQCTKASAQ